jgi:hypothetical protein
MPLGQKKRTPVWHVSVDTGKGPRIGDLIITTKDISWTDRKNQEHYIPKKTTGVIIKVGPIRVPGRMDWEVRPLSKFEGIITFFVEPGKFDIVATQKQLASLGVI